LNSLATGVAPAVDALLAMGTLTEGGALTPEQAAAINTAIATLNATAPGGASNWNTIVGGVGAVNNAVNVAAKPGYPSLISIATSVDGGIATVGGHLDAVVG